MGCISDAYWLKSDCGYERVIVKSGACALTPDDGDLPVLVECQGSGITKSVDRRRLAPADKVFGHRDNTALTYLNTANLLENISHRYQRSFQSKTFEGNIYTFTGWLLIALNPYRSIPSLYGEASLNLYPGRPISVVEPHPFAMAEAAYTALLKNWASQSIIISGESGSGKTECSKHVLKYLAFVSDRRHDANNQGIEYRVLQTNPILEAFGNAKTVRNCNSSRFGKLMKLHFDRQGRMRGASISTYLLAKSRVCHVPPGERNYHIFHWLCQGASAVERGRWGLRTSEEYRYLEGTTESDGHLQLQELRSALESIGIRRATQQNIFRVIAAVLTLGNLTFSRGKRSDGANDVTVLNRIKRPNLCPPVDEMENIVSAELDEVRLVCQLLGLTNEKSEDQLELIFTTKKIRDTRSCLSEQTAKQVVDALARSLYQLVFDYLVRRINASLRRWRCSLSRASPPGGSPRKTERAEETRSIPRVGSLPPSEPFPVGCPIPQSTASMTNLSMKDERCITHYIGVLDIFGFEDLRPFSSNNFEQLCINYANERLHNFFLHRLIRREREFYMMEGLIPPDISVTDNELVCMAIAGSHLSPGIFDFLDEASSVPVVGSKDEFFCTRVNGRLSGDGPYDGTVITTKGQFVMKEFVIQHFAGRVTYTADGFNEKNVDLISAEIKAFLLEECDPFISSELCSSMGGSNGMERQSTNQLIRMSNASQGPKQLARQRSSTLSVASVSNEAADRRFSHHPPQSGRPSTTERKVPPKVSLTARPSTALASPPLPHQSLAGSDVRFDSSDSDQSVDLVNESFGGHAMDAKRSKLAGRKQKEARRILEGRAKSLASLFRIQVDGLMATLDRTHSFFIRCIKPNDEQKPNLLDRSRVLQQLETGGMLAVLELMTLAFPCRVSFKELWDVYGDALPAAMKAAISPRDFTEVVLMYIKTRKEDYRIGNSRAFFRFGTLQQLEQISNVVDEAEKQKTAAATFHFWLAKKRQRAMTVVRYCCAVWLYLKKQRARALAAAAAGYWQAVYVPRLRMKATVRIQRIWRGVRARKEFTKLKRHRAAGLIQRAWRTFSSRAAFLALKDRASLLQSIARTTLAYAAFEAVIVATLTIQPASLATLRSIRFGEYSLARQHRAASIIQQQWQRSKALRSRMLIATASVSTAASVSAQPAGAALHPANPFPRLKRARPSSKDESCPSSAGQSPASSERKRGRLSTQKPLPAGTPAAQRTTRGSSSPIPVRSGGQGNRPRLDLAKLTPQPSAAETPRFPCSSRGSNFRHLATERIADVERFSVLNICREPEEFLPVFTARSRAESPPMKTARDWPDSPLMNAAGPEPLSQDWCGREHAFYTPREVPVSQKTSQASLRSIPETAAEAALMAGPAASNETIAGCSVDSRLLEEVKRAARTAWPGTAPEPLPEEVIVKILRCLPYLPSDVKLRLLKQPCGMGSAPGTPESVLPKRKGISWRRRSRMSLGNDEDAALRRIVADMVLDVMGDLSSVVSKGSSTGALPQCSFLADNRQYHSHHDEAFQGDGAAAFGRAFLDAESVAPQQSVRRRRDTVYARDEEATRLPSPVRRHSILGWGDDAEEAMIDNVEAPPSPLLEIRHRGYPVYCPEGEVEDCIVVENEIMDEDFGLEEAEQCLSKAEIDAFSSRRAGRELERMSWSHPRAPQSEAGQGQMHTAGQLRGSACQVNCSPFVDLPCQAPPPHPPGRGLYARTRRDSHSRPPSIDRHVLRSIHGTPSSARSVTRSCASVGESSTSDSVCKQRDTPTGATVPESRIGRGFPSVTRSRIPRPPSRGPSRANCPSAIHKRATGTEGTPKSGRRGRRLAPSGTSDAHLSGMSDGASPQSAMRFLEGVAARQADTTQGNPLRSMERRRFSKPPSGALSFH